MKRDLITADIARSLLDYDKETGDLTWRAREFLSPIKKHSAKRWNEIHAGKRACRPGNKGSFVVTMCDNVYLAHRVAWLIVNGEWPVDQIDHINGDRSDNRWCNLRSANNSQNQANKPIPASNKSGLKGVHKFRRKWTAQIGINGHRTWLGNFDCPAAASFAYQIARDKAFGDFSHPQIARTAA